VKRNTVLIIHNGTHFSFSFFSFFDRGVEEGFSRGVWRECPPLFSLWPLAFPIFFPFFSPPRVCFPRSLWPLQVLSVRSFRFRHRLFPVCFMEFSALAGPLRVHFFFCSMRFFLTGVGFLRSFLVQVLLERPFLPPFPLIFSVRSPLDETSTSQAPAASFFSIEISDPPWLSG